MVRLSKAGRVLGRLRLDVGRAGMVGRGFDRLKRGVDQAA